VDLVADAVPGAGVEDPVLRGDRLQVQVVVGVLEPLLQRVVIDVGDGLLGLHPGNPHRLELQVRHRPGGVLGEGLVDPDGDLLPGLLVAGNVVRVDDLLHDVLSHQSSPPFLGVLSSAIGTKNECVDSIRCLRRKIVPSYAKPPPISTTESGPRKAPRRTAHPEEGTMRRTIYPHGIPRHRSLCGRCLEP
jgi:hypothetical protein